MKNALNKTNKGFTIIEVMIVLAIAGLIMVIVFIAIPQLQRNQRDNARQNAVNRLEAELETYAGNNSGRYPFAASGTGSLADFTTRYITTPGVSLENPKTGNQYVLVAVNGTTTAPTPDQITVSPGQSCNGESVTGTYIAPGPTNNTKEFALRVQLDRGTTYYCVDNG